MSTSFIRSDSTLAGVAELVLDRAIARNALCLQMTVEMARQLERLASDPQVRVLILRAEGGHFAAGADIKEMLGMSPAEAEAIDFAGCCAALGDFPKPVIALVQGFALGGGCELVEMCDIVLAAEDAMFGHPEVRLGTMPGAGGTQRLPRLIGLAAASELLLSGRQMDAREAERRGLVARIVPRAELLAEGRKLAAELAALSASALVAIKQAVRATAQVPLDEGLRLERKSFHQTLSHPGCREGMRAFVEKRAARFNEAPSVP